MAKAIYSQKIVLFQEQFSLTAREKQGLTEITLFVALIYGCFWHEPSLASNPPFKLLNLLQNYPNRIIADAAFTAFSRHLWFFSESMVGLGFFDSRVDLDTKRAMVANLDLPETASGVKRVNASDADFSRL